ncbi:MAG: Flp pilus assembly protein CpaB [Actinomyces ruminicola]|uniref:Pilus assembly protein CpaB n=1 Tax=Actinomyces ruminicola TaxID=332524 RepID=A0A1H0AB76_9ACTO|nr:Flp pilus assembly protein CpaB [Actinomyces ruminicola]MBE6482335.1 Flp pilus assembly protein CpaB [Actinomyces ruminicola]SDN09962.1 pilus assembly protein CpaB [Actinomyces ruminicola]SDN29956.1 pilus assembly protein CpaB [Actinomyces ruminicola]
MNPRQRRGVLLLLVTLLGAALTFVGVAAYVSSVSSQVGPMTQVLELTTDVEAMHKITESDVEVVEVPKRWAPDNAVSSYGQVEGLVTVGAYTTGSVLQTGMLTDPPGLSEGNREVAIMVDAETGVAGRISSGDYVDIIATVEDENTKERTAQVVVQNALIINVGVTTTVESEDSSGAFSESQAVPVTFALSTTDSLKVAYAESFAIKLRLALRGTGDNAPLTDDQSVYSAPGAAPADPATEPNSSAFEGNQS